MKRDGILLRSSRIGACIFEIEGSLQSFTVSGWDPMSLLLYIVAAPCALQNLSSPIRDQTKTHSSESVQS